MRSRPNSPKNRRQQIPVTRITARYRAGLGAQLWTLATRVGESPPPLATCFSFVLSGLADRLPRFRCLSLSLSETPILSSSFFFRSMYENLGYWSFQIGAYYLWKKSPTPSGSDQFIWHGGVDSSINFGVFILLLRSGSDLPAPEVGNSDSVVLNWIELDRLAA